MKKLLFDMDGTLIDSMDRWARITYDYFLEKHPIPEEFLDISYGQPLRYSIDYALENYRVKESYEEVFDAIKRKVMTHYMEDFTLKPGVRSFLKKMNHDGYTMAVATATTDSITLPALSRHGILDYFAFVQTCDNVGALKSEEKYWLSAAEKLRALPGEIVVFEDALYCIETVKKLGFHVVAIDDRVAQKDRDQIIKLADCYIESYDELDLSLFN